MLTACVFSSSSRLGQDRFYACCNVQIWKDYAVQRHTLCGCDTVFTTLDTYFPQEDFQKTEHVVVSHKDADNSVQIASYILYYLTLFNPPDKYLF